MKGTAILLNEDQTVTCLEDVDHSLYMEMKQQEGCAQFECTIDNKEINFVNVESVLWCDDQVDWDYGY
ncbi:hypothetical protein FHP05_03575 [Cerasibacillus terrae]|uniref:Uncharacterized protein n=1 Tax=Cerasibacillus terrae TaxID=2498845 RepID=A0A5C8NZQ8_9BACI|nr:hypothetical protein [Cerasibacillus terrae]TXL66476.1 hypothetical protein FHP05_03575 [Cerasibacillus terrae]